MTLGARPRLLFLCQTLPHPPKGGVLIRTYNVLRLLAREYDVTALCFFRKADHPTRESVLESVEALALLARVRAFPIPQEHSTTRLLVDHGRSVLTGRAYTLRAYESAEFRSALQAELQATRFDLVHMDSLDLAGYLPSLDELPVICVHHNVESVLLRRRGKARGGLTGAYLRLQAMLTESVEREWCPRLRLNVAVSEPDRALLEALYPGSRLAVIPNGVDTAFFQPIEVEQQGIVFVGPSSWDPNREAMRFFCEAVLPKLRERGLTPSITWVGRVATADRAEFEAHGLRLTGFVDDIRSFVASAACYVAPLLAGGGTRLKILDAWAMGKAVVSTSLGCEGLAARDGENILIRDTPDGFAEAVAAVLGDAATRRHIGMAARETAQRAYDWEVIGREMTSWYNSVTPIATGASQASGQC